MIQAGEQAVTRFDEGACLLCNDWKPHRADAHNKNRFQSHIEKHLQELARDAIPLAIEGLEVRDTQSDEEIESEESQEGDQASLLPTPDPANANPRAEIDAFENEHEATEEQAGTETQAPDQQEGSQPPEDSAQLQESDIVASTVPAPKEYTERPRSPTLENLPVPASPDLELEEQFEAQVRAAVEASKWESSARRTEMHMEAQKNPHFDPMQQAEEDERMGANTLERRKRQDEYDQLTEAKDPIRFKDAVGRRFSFPFHLCATWQVSSFTPRPTVLPTLLKYTTTTIGNGGTH